MSDRLSGKLAVVWGLGVFGGGAAVARHLAQEGARVRVLDQKPATKLGPSLDALADLDLELVLGRDHRWEDFADADLVVKSPAIPPRVSWNARLAEAGIPVTSELLLGLAQVDVPYAMVTGSKGKSTTTGLLGAMLEAAGLGAETAGNNERPLLACLAESKPGRLVLEVSSFMADAVAQARAQGTELPAPEVLALTSLSPEHLNWHGDVEAYYEAKLSLIDLGPRAVVMPAADAELNARVPGRLGRDPIRVGEGAYAVEDGVAYEESNGERRALFATADLALLGAHNVTNALVAAAAACAFGVPHEAIARAVREFRPLAHRLETVAVSASGVRFVNDSIATTPAAAQAALRSVPAPVVLLAGGSDKGASYEGLAQAAAAAHAVVCLGEIRGAIASALEEAIAAGAGSAQVDVVDGSFEEAFARGLELCPPGGALLLAPATASYDMFPNFKARGERFRELAEAACRG